jgi:hypothetical protein
MKHAELLKSGASARETRTLFVDFELMLATILIPRHLHDSAKEAASL